MEHSIINKWEEHKIGECYVADKFTYIHIPKNASTSTKFYIDNIDGLTCKHQIGIPADALNYLVILREPIERWVSGIAEFQCRALDYYNGSYDFELTLEEIFNKITFDDHSELQTYFLQPLLDFKKVTFFKCDDTINQTFPAAIKALGINTNNEYLLLNNSTGQKLKYKLRLQEALDSNPAYVQKLKEYFALDYELYNSVQYVNG